MFGYRWKQRHVLKTVDVRQSNSILPCYLLHIPVAMMSNALIHSYLHSDMMINFIKSMCMI